MNPKGSSAHRRALGACVYVLGKQLEGRGWPIEIVGDPQKDASVALTVRANGKELTVSHGVTPAEGFRIGTAGKVEHVRQLRFDPQKQAMVGPNGQDGSKFLQGRVEKFLGGKTPPA